MLLTLPRNKCFIFYVIFILLSSFNLSVAQENVHVNREWQNPLPQGNRLHQVWAANNQNVFAVGEDGVILHYDGNRWNIMYSGNGYWLHGIWGSSAHDVFAVGRGGTILHYDGSNWTEMNNDTGDSV